MEGIQTINALKAVVSSLPAQTTIPSSELVMLYAADGTPIAKIARDDLVKAVASVMASNSQNTFSKLLGVQANGTPMGIGASDLASVLGVEIKGSIYGFPTEIKSGITLCYVQDGNIDGVSMYGVCLTIMSGGLALQIIEDQYGRGLFVRYTDGSSAWQSWKKISFVS